MARRADVLVAQTTGLLQFTGAGTGYVVQIPPGVTGAGTLYLIYVDTGSDLAFKKSTDGGLSWSLPTVIFAGTVVSFAVWYDRWSSIAAGLIHLAYTESGGSDTLYRTINTESSDALSTQTTIFAGTSTAANGHLSITRARGGNVYCKTVIDNGAEGGFFRLPNANVPNGAWDAARTINEALSGSDQIILVPGFAADTQDIMAIWLDASANEISRQIHDDSANSWAEATISGAGNVVEQAASVSFPNFSAAVDVDGDRIIVVFWSAIDTVNADLRCFTVTESAITETDANVVLNSTDDQGLCGISIDIGNPDIGRTWTVFYGGASAGGETYLTSINLYCKGSGDGGETWSPETLVTLAARDITWLAVCPYQFGTPVVAFHRDSTLDDINISVDRMQPSAAALAGVM